MNDVTVSFHPDHEAKGKDQKLAVLDEEVARFSDYMAKLDDARARGALSNPEKALIKTYLVAKLREKL
jgi:hypothetical protein